MARVVKAARAAPSRWPIAAAGASLSRRPSRRRGAAPAAPAAAAAAAAPPPPPAKTKFGGLADADRIFPNLYGDADWRLKDAVKRVRAADSG